MTSPDAGADDERLIGYVRQALERLERGETVHPADLCRDHPELAPALADALGLAADLPQLQAVARAADPLEGMVLAGRYRLEQCLGRGAMGVVYRALDTELQRAVAIKILDARLFADPSSLPRFLREGQALAAVRHPAVVAIFDRGRTPDGIAFLVMELLAGASFAQIVERCPPPESLRALAALDLAATEPDWHRQCARWARQLADGLGAAHQVGIVHRDVKPSNAFLCRDGRAMLLDFGIASRLDDSPLTATATTLGTPWYMAPEQIRAAANAAPPADVYGLCASLWHLLAGRPPYQGDPAAVLVAVATTDPPPLRQVRPDIPRDLAAIVEHGMERQPARRYADGNALAADLDAFLRHQPVSARPIGPLARRLRAYRRAPARPLAVLVGVLVLFVLAVVLPIWNAARADAMAQEKQQLLARLPSLLAIEGWPDQRLLAVLRSEHQAALAQLDRLLELDPDELPVRLFRLLLRADLGDHDGMAADLAAIEASHDGPFLRALLDRYRCADPQQAGALALDLTGLPAPATPEEQFVAGLHELRARHVAGYGGRADALLAAAEANYPWARDLRLISRMACVDERPADAATLLEEICSESLVLEGIYGGPTARTLAMRGAALVSLRRYRQAIPVLEESLRLRPDRHGPHLNLGIALRHETRVDEAQQHLERSLQLRPFADNSKHALAQLHRDRGDFAKARELAAAIEPTARELWSVKQPELLGSIATFEAVAALRAGGDPAPAAAVAVAHYDVALSAAKANARVQKARAFAAALQQQDRNAAVRLLMEAMRATNPDDPYQLGNLALLLPEAGLSAESVAALRALLRRLAERLGGEDEVLLRQLRGDAAKGR
ncbi:MAG: protein kinase [Planctomycetes bacterium]|nr:protein kinase [Planctomycetota bacterium]